MKKYIKILVILVVVFCLVFGGYFVYHYFKNKNQNNNPQNEVKITNTIEQFGYNLEDRDTELFKSKFEELQKLLEEENYNKEDYIRLVSELFIIDFFTIDNKISRYDIGGLEYVYSGAVESFRSVAENSIYKTVENNLDKNRTQDLPIVTNIEVTELSPSTFKMPDDSEVDAYRVALSWEYEEDLGYDSSAVLLLIWENDKIGVVFYK